MVRHFVRFQISPWGQTMRHKLFAALALCVLAVALLVWVTYRRDIARIRAELALGSSLIDTRHGPVEVAIHGNGPPVLVLHGAGGGYDQGLILARMFGDDRHRWIAISRFGYLQSVLTADPSTRAQAEALADVLDTLGIDRAGILAMSGGVPPALQFASLYPDRITGLALLSPAPFTPLTAAAQDLPMPAWAYQMLFATDLPFWALIRASPRTLDAIFDVTPVLRRRLTPAETAMVNGLVLGFLPVTDRIAGLANEGTAIDPAARYNLAHIIAPTLVVHARDDGINPFPIGEYLAASLSRARFIDLPDGGHLLLGHSEAVAEAVTAILTPPP
jgi:2-hydroxy-6-oxonona-2,4-dienedioate hydrolase